MASMDLQLQWLSKILLLLLTIRICSADCNYEYKIRPGFGAKLSNYGLKNRKSENCQYIIKSDTGIEMKCLATRLQENWKCQQNYDFTYYPNYRRSKANKYCGGYLYISADRNIMVVDLKLPIGAPEELFDCYFTVPTSCNCGWKGPLKIHGGENTGPNEFPMMAGLIELPVTDKNKIVTSDSVYCGGTIISPRHILTAAHCLYQKKVEEIYVLVGVYNIAALSRNDARTYAAKRLLAHERYNNVTNHNDIGLVFIDGTIEYTNKVGPACLPHKSAWSNLINQKVQLLGWGLQNFAGNKPSILQKVTVDVTQCKDNNPLVFGNKICTYADQKDACQMDSGGPVLQTSYVNGWARVTSVGVISWGIGCGGRAEPAYNTQVGPYLYWIFEKTSGDNTKYCAISEIVPADIF